MPSAMTTPLISVQVKRLPDSRRRQAERRFSQDFINPVFIAPPHDAFAAEAG